VDKELKAACYQVKGACHNVESMVENAEWEVTKLLPDILKPLYKLMDKCLVIERVLPIAIAVEEMRLSLLLAKDIQKAATEVVDSFSKKEFANTEGAEEVLITEPVDIDSAEDKDK